MAVLRYPILERLSPLIDLQIHQIARKTFHYHDSAAFPYNLLISVLSGDASAGDYFRNGRSGAITPLQVGHAYLLPCHLPIHYERTPGYTVVTMRFNLTFFYGLDIFDGLTDIQDLRAPAFTARLEKLLGQRNPDYVRNALLLKNEVTRLCLSCWPGHWRDATPAMWRYEETLRNVREKINATFTVADLAKRGGLRQDVFSRSFARDLGITPKRFLNDLLTRRVSACLLASPRSVKEIAGDLGLSSPYYLSRFFKKQTRLSPREYRRRFQDTASEEFVAPAEEKEYQKNVDIPGPLRFLERQVRRKPPGA